MRVGEVSVETGQLDTPVHLSPSSINTWEQCPYKFKLSRLDKISEPPTEAQMLGNFTHEILESLYLLPHGERTTNMARSIAASLWASRWSELTKQLHLNDEEIRRFRWQVWWFVEALFRLEDPTTVTLAGVEQKLEVNVSGVKLLGFMDRWHVGDDQRAVISDYKTGKKPRPQYEGEKRFQLGVYTYLVQEALGVEVGYAELIYLKEGLRWGFEPNSQFVDSVVSTVERVWSEIKESCSDGVFVARRHKLCDWCSFKVSCPAWR